MPKKAGNNHLMIDTDMIWSDKCPVLYRLENQHMKQVFQVWLCLDDNRSFSIAVDQEGRVASACTLYVPPFVVVFLGLSCWRNFWEPRLSRLPLATFTDLNERAERSRTTTLYALSLYHFTCISFVTCIKPNPKSLCWTSVLKLWS